MPFTDPSRSRFFAYVQASRARLRNHPGHSSQKSHGRKGSGDVRDALADAETIDEINSAASVEARRITGRDIHFDMEGQDAQVAREQVEGVLRGLERFPDAQLVGVQTYGLGRPLPDAGPEQEGWAGVTRSHGVMVDGKFTMQSNIYFNTNMSADEMRSVMRQSEADGHLVSGTPMGTGIHEMGHVVTTTKGITRDVYDVAVDHADAAGVTPRAYISKHVSEYASQDMSEYSAEAFTDVMVNGSSASGVSQASVAVMQAAYSGTKNLRGSIIFAYVQASRARLRNHPGHADQKSHGRSGGGTGGGGVRSALSGHDTAREVSSAAAGEARRITGRDIEFALEGDPQIAAEHAEGVLRGLTVYPDAPLNRVQSGADGGIDHPYASTDVETGTLSFATEQGNYRENLAMDDLHGDIRVPTPTGVALHEFGHIVAGRGGANDAAVATARKMAKRDGMADNPHGYAADKISSRAGNGPEELTAEAFSDVMTRGSGAAELSKAIVDTVNESYGS